MINQQRTSLSSLFSSVSDSESCRVYYELTFPSARLALLFCLKQAKTSADGVLHIFVAQRAHELG
jgi:hypothetical protein